MHKSQYKFTKKKNKCDVTIKSTITKRAISRKKKKVVETIKIKKIKNIKRGKKIGEREYWPWNHGQLEKNRRKRRKWNKKKLIWKLRWKRKGGSRWNVEQSETVEFKKI